eukprot:3894529-Prymnesium_polylepis.1
MHPGDIPSAWVRSAAAGAENGVLPRTSQILRVFTPNSLYSHLKKRSQQLFAAVPSPPTCLLMAWLVCTSVPKLQIFQHSFESSGVRRPGTSRRPARRPD